MPTRRSDRIATAHLYTPKKLRTRKAVAKKSSKAATVVRVTKHKKYKHKIDPALARLLAASAEAYVRSINTTTTKGTVTATTTDRRKSTPSKSKKRSQKTTPPHKPPRTTPATTTTTAAVFRTTASPIGVVDRESGIVGSIFTLDSAPSDVMLVRVDPATGTDDFYVLQLISRTTEPTDDDEACPEEETPLTLVEQQDLTEAINGLNEENLHFIIEIIKESADFDRGVIDVDIDKLDTVTQRKLQTFMRKRKGNNIAFTVYSRWGRTGTVGETLPLHFDEEHDAVECFRAKFLEKTGLEWRNRDDADLGGTDYYRAIRQNLKEKEGGYAGGKWQYWVDNGVDGKADDWYDYTEAGSVQVERLYQEHSSNGDGRLSNRVVDSGHFAYSVDLRKMTQTNVRHPARTTRRIRRVAR